jgi:hypothetical protein
MITTTALLFSLKILSASAKEIEGKSIFTISRREKKRMFLLLIKFNNILPCSNLDKVISGRSPIAFLTIATVKSIFPLIKKVNTKPLPYSLLAQQL